LREAKGLGKKRDETRRNFATYERSQ
jgi:hypothetical protein